jgi:hypothetical protein
MPYLHLSPPSLFLRNANDLNFRTVRKFPGAKNPRAYAAGLASTLFFRVFRGKIPSSNWVAGAARAVPSVSPW